MTSILLSLVAVIHTLAFVQGQLGSPLTTSNTNGGLPGAIADGIARTTGNLNG